jgi:magnesium-transporting ATPase (P-type)
MVEVPFDSKVKMGSVVVDRGNCVRIYSKGAPDFMFPEVNSVLMKDGVVGWTDEASQTENI